MKRRAIFQYHRKNADILIIQETHSKVENEKIWESEWGGRAIYSHGTPAARGIAVFLKKEIFPNVGEIFIGNDGRVIMFNIREKDMNITIVALYAPNKDSPLFFSQIEEQLKERSEHKIVIGDFNLTLDVELDRKNTYCNNNKALQEVENIMDHYLLKDIWRIRYKEKREYSWFKKDRTTGERKASRIDLALVSGGLDQYIEHTQYLSSIETDHRALYMLVDVSQVQRGRGFWKLNTSYLSNRKYVEEMNTELQISIQSTQNWNPQDRWGIHQKESKEKDCRICKKCSLR